MIRNFFEATEALRLFYDRPGSNSYTLDRMRTLVKYLGNPQEKLKVVHIAGTSGKTSTAYYAAALLQEAGFSVGLTVSPHVVEVNERLQFNLVPLNEKNFCAALSEFLELVNASGIEPSYFELMVAFAFREFARRNIDYAVVEVGLGGLLDATNVISRADKVCVITDIGLDHTNILGKTLRQIAAQKAGIIQSGNVVFAYEQNAEIMDAINKACRSRRATLHKLTDEKVRPYENLMAGLPLFQRRNFCLAEQAVSYVFWRDKMPALTDGQFKQALATQIPDRMEIRHVKGKTIVFDGAHNEQKMAALVTSMHAMFPDQKAAALAAFVSTKDGRWQAALDELADYADAIIATAPGSSEIQPKKFVPPQEIAAYLDNRKLAFDTESEPSAAFAKLLARPESLLLVTGTLYLYGTIKPLHND